MAVTLKDVAAHAGVSPKTVSNVVHGYTFVSTDVRRRVQQSLEELGYVPNLGARNLRRGQTGFIALGVPELANPYFADLANLVITAAAQHDWTVLIEQTQGSPEREKALVGSTMRQRVDAVLLSPIGLRPTDLAAASDGPPLVLLGERILDAAVDHVAIDNVKAAATATQHLIDIGCRRIAAIGSQPSRGGTAALRLKGHRDALRDAGLPSSRELIVPATAYHRAEGASAMRHLLSMKRPPDAVFCFNDLLAIGAISAIRDAGLSVPGDVAVAGFDDIEEGAYGSPRLTTISPDKTAIAATAVDLARQRLASTDRTPHDIETPFALTIRESTDATMRGYHPLAAARAVTT